MKNIILLHGWGASTKKLEPLKKELERLGWDVLLPKLPGFDATTPDKSWYLGDYSDYIFKIATEKWKNGKFAVFGHSFGGRVAINMALTNDKKVAGIVLCATGGISRASIIKRIPFYIMAKTGKMLNMLPPLANFWRNILYKAAQEHDYERANDLMKDTMKNIINEDLKTKIARIKVPVLILWGKVDKMTPFRDAIYINENVKKSTLVDYPHQGHKLPYKLPSQLAKEIDKWSH